MTDARDRFNTKRFPGAVNMVYADAGSKKRKTHPTGTMHRLLRARRWSPVHRHIELLCRGDDPPMSLVHDDLKLKAQI